MFKHSYTNPQFLHVLIKIDFDVPRRDISGSNGLSFRGTVERLTKLERKRYRIAQQFSPFWFHDPVCCYFNELDRLILLTDHDLECPTSEITTIKPSTQRNDCCHTILVFEDGNFEIITDFKVNPVKSEDRQSRYQRTRFGYDYLGDDYQDKYPTAQTAMALKRIVA